MEEEKHLSLSVHACTRSADATMIISSSICSGCAKKGELGAHFNVFLRNVGVG